jgi:1-acyl-sn-glycerol-3-phosphate acyltransferase
MLYFLGRSISYIFVKFFCGFKVTGRANIPKKGGFILASNHASYLDPLVLGAASSRRMEYFAKEELFKNKLFAKILYAVGAFPVKRNKMDLFSIKEAIRRLKEGRALVMFPEGTRSTDGQIHDAQEGVGFLASKAEVPVIPAYISGTDKVLPKNAKSLKLNKIRVYFGEKIDFERRQAYADVSNMVIQRIRQLACNLS